MTFSFFDTALTVHPCQIGPRSEVDVYVDGDRCKVDGIWFKPNDPVVVLDAAFGQYNAKYLFSADDEVWTLNHPKWLVTDRL